MLHKAGSGTSELVELAQGWPAVLALASMSDAALPDLTAAPHLYGFFADEIYRRIDRRVRRTLCELALYDTAGRHLALSQLRPDVVKRVIATGVDNGFLTELQDNRLDMHPLVRAFLRRKLEAEGSASASESVERAAGVLIQHRLWDEAFELIQRFEQERLMTDLVGASMGRAPRGGPSCHLARMDFPRSQRRSGRASRDCRAGISRRPVLRIRGARRIGRSRSSGRAGFGSSCQHGRRTRRSRGVA